MLLRSRRGAKNHFSDFECALSPATKYAESHLSFMERIIVEMWLKCQAVWLIYDYNSSVKLHYYNSCNISKS
jgi:hypothetical protein